MKYIICLILISQTLSQVIERDNKLLWDGTDWKFISKRSASNPESIYRIKSAYINGLLDGRLYYYLKAWGENQSFADSIYADRVDYMTPKETIRQIDRFYQDPLMDYVPVISALIIVHMQVEQAHKRIVEQYIYQTKLWINNLILNSSHTKNLNLLP